MSPLIPTAVGPLHTYPFEADPYQPRTAPAKERIASGNQFFTLDEGDPDMAIATCDTCHREIPFGRGTSWAEIDATMKAHREKFCPARIEVGRAK